jgi:hypothetical protein
VTDTAITAEVHQAFDVHRCFAPKVAFDHEIGDSRTQIGDFRFGQILDFRIRLYTCGSTNLLRPRVANAKDRRQPNHDVLV